MVPSAAMRWRGSAISSTSGPMSLAGQSRAIICSRASAGLGALRIRRIISSMLATATARPTNTCARSRDLASRCLVRRLTTSSRKAVKAAMKSLRLSCSGRPPLIASMLAPKLVCRSEWRHSWFSTTSAIASRFSSMTMRMPSRLVSSQMLEMPSSFFSRTCSAIFSISTRLFTW